MNRAQAYVAAQKARRRREQEDMRRYGPPVGNLCATISIDRYFGVYQAEVTGRITCAPEPASRHCPASAAEIEVDEYATATGPNRKFRARLNDNERSDAYDALLLAWQQS